MFSAKAANLLLWVCNVNGALLFFTCISFRVMLSPISVLFVPVGLNHLHCLQFLLIGETRISLVVFKGQYSHKELNSGEIV